MLVSLLIPHTNLLVWRLGLIIILPFFILHNPFINGFYCFCETTTPQTMPLILYTAVCILDNLKEALR